MRGAGRGRIVWCTIGAPIARAYRPGLGDSYNQWALPGRMRYTGITPTGSHHEPNPNPSRQ